MTNKITESIFSSDTLVVPLADVQHIEKRMLQDEEFLMVVMKSTRYNNQIGEWDNAVYIPTRLTPSFLKSWCSYRHELEGVNMEGGDE